MSQLAAVAPRYLGAGAGSAGAVAGARRRRGRPADAGARQRSRRRAPRRDRLLLPDGAGAEVRKHQAVDHEDRRAGSRSHATVRCVAPRAPNTVPEAPAPKPAPASAPLPRWSSTSTTMQRRREHLDDGQRAECNTSRCADSLTPNARAAVRMSRNSSALSEAPPISPPSTSGIANSSAALPALTLPP